MPTPTTPRPCLHGYTTASISFDVFTSISGGGHGWGRNGLGMACDASPLIFHEFSPLLWTGYKPQRTLKHLSRTPICGLWYEILYAGADTSNW
jgi:hypothetical protein